jgi:hypothetical protein
LQRIDTMNLLTLQTQFFLVTLLLDN